MDDTRLPFAAAVTTFRGTELPDAELPAGFVPLHLMLQPVGLRLELSRSEMILGRHSQADIRLCLPDISRRHCRFVFHDSHWQVFDLHSMNGVFVNGARVDEATLCSDDLLQIGSLTFKVQLATAPHEADVNILPGPNARTQQHRKAS